LALTPVTGWRLDPRGFFSYILGFMKDDTQQVAAAVALVDGDGAQTGTAGNPLAVSASFSPSGTQDVNLAQVDGAAISEGNAVPTQISVDNSAVGTTNPLPVAQYSGGVEVPAGTQADPLRVDPTGTTPQPVSGTVAVSGTPAVNLSQVGGVAASAANPVPVQASVGGSAASATNPLPAQISVANAAATASNPVPVRPYTAGGVAVPAGTQADPLRVDPTGTTPQPVSGTVAVSGTPAVNLSQVGGVTASATNPLPAQLSVSNAAASAANPVPVQSSVGGVVVSASNPIPVQQYTSGGVAVPAGTAADPSYAFPGARTDAAAVEVEASRAFVVAGRACASVAMRDYAAVVWTILPTNLGTNTTLTITILSQSASFAAGDSLAGIGKVLADQLLASATVATPAFGLVAYTPTVSTTSVATLVANQPIKIYCTKRDLYMGISVAGTAADGAYSVTALRMV